ncbi:MAG TPA: FliM/FliN family flagellar motor C-terminal domain-containing protein [Sphingopyxis sp.]|nr:FliM/FliN family flagellar motor C-terminal domain-containing protein [Sphingopyxis sp.]
MSVQTAEARPWLPPGALASGRTVSAIRAVVDAWAAHWFTVAPVVSGARWAARTDDGCDGAEWEVPVTIAEGLSMQARSGATEVVARALVALPGERPARGTQDQALLHAAAATVVGDLRERLARAVPARCAARGGAILELTLGDLAGRPVFRLLADEALLAGIARDGVPPKRALPSPAKRDEAIDPRPVEAAALAGRARIAYADLLDLAPGDVLILDTPCDAAFDLLVDGRIAARKVVPADHFSNPVRDKG